VGAGADEEDEEDEEDSLDGAEEAEARLERRAAMTFFALKGLRLRRDG